MVSITDYKREDGSFDWDSYRKARDEERRDEVSRGKRCRTCGEYIVFSHGRITQCYSCEHIASDLDDVRHDTAIRCPKCRRTEKVGDGDNYDLYEEGEHEVTCGYCNHEYTVETQVSYSFTSPSVVESEPDPDDEDE